MIKISRQKNYGRNKEYEIEKQINGQIQVDSNSGHGQSQMDSKRGDFSWAKIVQAKECFHDGMGLSFIRSESDKVVLKEEDVVEGLKKWKHVAVGFVLGKAPPFQAIKIYMEQKWRHPGNVEQVMLKIG